MSREDVDKLTPSEIKNFGKTIITGLAGSGKSYASTSFGGKGFKVTRLDNLGAKINGKWLVNTGKISPKATIIEGICDNLNSVFKDFEADTVLIIRASVQDLKKEWLKRSKDERNQFRDEFEIMSQVEDKFVAEKQKKFEEDFSLPKFY